MAKIQLKSDNINPFGGLFSILKQFDRSGLRRTIDSTLGKRGATRAAFSYGDVFASLFGSYLCGGDCIEDILKTVAAHCEHFYIRASNCRSRYTEFMEHVDWIECRICGQQCGVASFRLDSMLPRHRRPPSATSFRTAGQRKSRANDPAFFMLRLRHPGDAYRLTIDFTPDFAKSPQFVRKYVFRGHAATFSLPDVSVALNSSCQ